MEKESFFSEDEPFFDDKIRKDIEEVSYLLRKEKPKKEIIQRSICVGYFCPLVKKGDSVEKDQTIGFMRIPGGEKDEIIKAQTDGVIKEILPAQETGFTPIKKQEGGKTLTSVEYKQILFIIEQE